MRRARFLALAASAGVGFAQPLGAQAMPADAAPAAPALPIPAPEASAAPAAPVAPAPAASPAPPPAAAPADMGVDLFYAARMAAPVWLKDEASRAAAAK